MVYKNIVPKIVKLNIFVFLLWNIYGFINLHFMTNNFLVSWSAINEGRFWTLLTSVFSHNFLLHILLNMFVFYNFGVIIERVLGSKRFLKFYLLAGIAGSLVHCFVSEFIMHQPNISALGASGAVSGVVLLFALLFPFEKVFLFGLIPIPAIWAALMFTGLDLWGLINQTKGSSIAIGFGAHLGGALAAFIYFIGIRRPHRSTRHLRI